MLHEKVLQLKSQWGPFLAYHLVHATVLIYERILPKGKKNNDAYTGKDMLTSIEETETSLWTG